MAVIRGSLAAERRRQQGDRCGSMGQSEDGGGGGSLAAGWQQQQGDGCGSTQQNKGGGDSSGGSGSLVAVAKAA